MICSKKGGTYVRREALKATFINIIILWKADSCSKPSRVHASHSPVGGREVRVRIYLSVASYFLLPKSLKNLRIMLSSQSQRNHPSRRVTTISENAGLLCGISINEAEKRKRPC